MGVMSVLALCKKRNPAKYLMSAIVDQFSVLLTSTFSLTARFPAF